MEHLLHAELTPEQALALASSRADLRATLASYFALDRRLGQLVANTSEPMLGQMRLAWWRDMLGKPAPERPTGDTVLDSVGRHWAGEEDPLLLLVDAWEEFLVTESLSSTEAALFCRRRTQPLEHLAKKIGSGGGARVHVAGIRWAAAETALRLSKDDERRAMIAAGTVGLVGSESIPRALRGIGVLEALAMRSLKRGGRPLMEGRAAALIALRVGLLGR